MVHTFEVVAGSWGSRSPVGVQVASRVMGEIKIAKIIDEMTLILETVFVNAVNFKTLV